MGNLKYPIINEKKECSKCHEFKTLDNFTKDKNYYSPKCKRCTNEELKIYRNLPENKQRRRKYHQDYKKILENREKLNKRMREWRKTPKGRKIQNRSRRNWTLIQKRKSIEYKGGKCIVCGYNKCEAALEFHHPNPTIKIKLKDSTSFENSKKELDKCVLLCCICHRELHANLIKLEDSL